MDTTDCGAACVATIAKHYNLKIPIAKIRDMAGTDKSGTNVYGLVKCLENIGFSAKGVKGNAESFNTKFPLPCIAHVVVNGSFSHYIVIHKVYKDKMIIADPIEGIIKIDKKDFLYSKEDGNMPKYIWTGIIVLAVPNRALNDELSQKGTISKFFDLIKPHKKMFLHIFVASIVYTLCGILGAFYYQYIIDEIIPSTLEKTLLVLSVAAILLKIFQVALNACRTQLLIYLSQKLDIDLLLGYYQHVIELPVKFFDTRKIGEIISRFQDASKVREAITGATMSIIIDTLMVVFGGIILFNENKRMFGITIVMIVCYIIIVFCFSKKYDRLNKNQMEDNAQLNTYLIESLNGVQTIKTYNAETKAHRETEKRFIRFLKSTFAISWMENFQNSLKYMVEYIGEVVILWIGAYSVIHMDITVGQLVVFNSLLVYFLDPLKRLIDLQPQMQAAIVAAERLGEIMDLEKEKTNVEQHKIQLDHVLGNIEFKNVYF